MTVQQLQQFLAQAMIREGLKNVTAGANPVGIRKGIDKAVAAAVTELKAISKPIEGQRVNRTSCSNLFR